MNRKLLKRKLQFILLGVVVLAFPMLSSSGTSGNVDLNSWVYPALERLGSVSLVESALVNTRPLTRIEAARLFAEAIRSFEEEEYGESLNKTIAHILQKAKKEFKDELAILEVTGDFKTTTFIKPIDAIRLEYSSLHGQYSIYNNEGIEHTDEGNFFLRFSGRSKFFNFLSFEYQNIFKYHENPGIAESTDSDLQKYSMKLSFRSLEFEMGRGSLWWGPGFHGALLMTNNARPFDLLKVSNPIPVLLPSIFSSMGPFRVTFVLSKLDDDRPILEPYLYGLRFNFKPVPDLELGLSHIAIFDGQGIDLSFSETLDVLYSNQNLAGSKESNQQLAVDFSVWLHDIDRIIPHLGAMKLYAEAGAEDTGSPPDRRAFLFGVLFKDIIFSGKTDLRIEFVDTSPSSVPTAWYNHNDYPAFYEGRVFGHHVGSDAEDLFIRSTLSLNSDLTAGMDFDAEKRGISSAVQEKHSQFGIDLSYEISYKMEIKGRYGVENIKNNNFVNGDDIENHFFSGELTIGF